MTSFCSVMPESLGIYPGSMDMHLKKQYMARPNMEAKKKLRMGWEAKVAGRTEVRYLTVTQKAEPVNIPAWKGDFSRAACPL